MPAFPNQAPGLAASLGLTRAEVDASAWVVDRSGHRWSGAAAVNRVLEELGGPWSVLARVYRAPGAGWIEEGAYSWFARNRARIGRWEQLRSARKPGRDGG